MFRIFRVMGCVALMSALWVEPALSGTLQVNPVLVEINANRRTGLVTVRNVENTPITIRSHVLGWSQASGDDSYTKTSEIIVSPPVFTIPGGGSQNVRVGLRRPAAAGHAYRLIIEEVPEARTEGAVQVAIRLNIPLYAMVPRGEGTDLAWAATRNGEGRFTLEATNRGRGYVRLDQSAVRAATGLSVRSDDNFGTVLPGATRRWALGNETTVEDQARLNRILRTTNALSPALSNRN